MKGSESIVKYVMNSKVWKCLACSKRSLKGIPQIIGSMSKSNSWEQQKGQHRAISRSKLVETPSQGSQIQSWGKPSLLQHIHPYS